MQHTEDVHVKTNESLNFPRRGVKPTQAPFDRITVEEAIAGKKPYLHPADRHEVIRRLLSGDHGRWTVRQIAEHVDCDRRTVRNVINADRARGVAA